MPGLHILSGQAWTFHVIHNTIINADIFPPGLFWLFSLSDSFNLPRYTAFDPVIVIFSFNISKPSQPAISEVQKLIIMLRFCLTAMASDYSRVH